jgi:2-C-methyl-D-erythritol 4-phosphate cytidylyltransferase
VSVWTIVVAAGTGERFGGPKQRMMLGGRTVMDHAIDAARRASDGVVVVIPADADWSPEHVITVAGGATRSESVRAGLAAVPATAEIVLVHDAARPLADDEVFARVINAVRAGADAAVPGLPIGDTIKEVRDGVVVATVPRDSLVTAQTPQAFRGVVLRTAHQSAPEGTDDAAVVERAGGTVVVVPGAMDNIKITNPGDLERAVALLATRGAAS